MRAVLARVVTPTGPALPLLLLGPARMAHGRRGGPQPPRDTEPLYHTSMHKPGLTRREGAKEVKVTLCDWGGTTDRGRRVLRGQITHQS